MFTIAVCRQSFNLNNAYGINWTKLRQSQHCRHRHPDRLYLIPDSGYIGQLSNSFHVKLSHNNHVNWGHYYHTHHWSKHDVGILSSLYSGMCVISADINGVDVNTASLQSTSIEVITAIYDIEHNTILAF